MKHSLRITVYLLILFACSQMIGLAVVNKYIDHKTSVIRGEATFTSLPYSIERPPTQDFSSIIYILVGIALGTIILLIIIKYRKRIVWKVWFFLAVLLCLSIAFSAYIPQYIALALAALLGYLKVFRANLFAHNFSEVFIYGGIAAVFVPILNVPAVIVLLLIISAYDIIAVWYSKHMVKLAEFQKGSKVFAGVMIPSSPESQKPAHGKKAVSHHAQKKSSGSPEVSGDDSGSYAILGGGDIAFPLLFSGVVMKGLMLKHFIFTGFAISLFITLGATLALAGLFLYAKKNHYYPAMPYLTAGCLLGWLVTLLL